MRVIPCLPLSLFALLAGLSQPVFAEYDPKIIAYVPFWKNSVIDYEKITHINYAFALPQADGHLKAVANTSKLTSIVQDANQAGVKVFISVGGWSDVDANGNLITLDSIFEGIGADPTRRANLVTDIMGVVNQYGLDGVDLDWEFPNPGASADNFNSLMCELHSQLQPNGKQLTAAVGIESAGDGYTSAIKDKVDWVNIMSYNHYNPNSTQHATFDNALASVAQYQAKGFSNDQLVLGVPFYGKDASGEVCYADLLALGADPHQDSFNGYGYNGIDTIVQKAQFVNANQLAGMMFW